MSLYELSSILPQSSLVQNLDHQLQLYLLRKSQHILATEPDSFFWGGGDGGLVPYFCMHSIISRHTFPAPADPLQASIIIPFYNIYSCLFLNQKNTSEFTAETTTNLANNKTERSAFWGYFMNSFVSSFRLMFYNLRCSRKFKSKQHIVVMQEKKTNKTFKKLY